MLKINKNIVYPEIFVDKAKKVITIGRTEYPLIYALCCPFSDYPVMALLKREKDIPLNIRDKFHSYSKVGDVVGFTAFGYNTRLEGLINERDDIVPVRYFYGFKEDVLFDSLFNLRHLIQTRGAVRIRDKKLNKFKDNVLKGNYGFIRMSREVVTGEDVCFAVADNCSMKGVG